MVPSLAHRLTVWTLTPQASAASVAVSNPVSVPIGRQSCICTLECQPLPPAVEWRSWSLLHVSLSCGTMLGMNNPELQTAASGPWTIGERLAKARRGSTDGPLNQEALAERLGLVRATIGRYEAGKIPDNELKRTVVAWAFATGWRYEWLLTGRGPWLRDGTDPGPQDGNSGSEWNVPVARAVLKVAV